MNISFNKNDIEKATEGYKIDLERAVRKLPSGDLSMEDIQRWARQYNVENQGLLELVLKKNRQRRKVS